MGKKLDKTAKVLTVAGTILAVAKAAVEALSKK